MQKFGYFVRRFFAFGADWYLSAVLINLLSNGIERLLPQGEERMYLSLLLGTIIVSFVWFVLVPTFVWKGQTLMMRAMQMKIVGKDGNAPKLLTLFFRYFVGCLIFEGAFYIPSVNIRTVLLLTVLQNQKTLGNIIAWAVFLSSIIGLILGVSDWKEHRFLHDRISGTKVVEAPRALKWMEKNS